MQSPFLRTLRPKEFLAMSTRLTEDLMLLMMLRKSLGSTSNNSLYLRWMVRNVDVDPGGWAILYPYQLIIPTDIHIFRIASALHLTSKKAPNINSAIDISNTLSKCHYADPIRYDFPLCRLGLRLHYFNLSLSEYAHYTT